MTVEGAASRPPRAGPVETTPQEADSGLRQIAPVLEAGGRRETTVDLHLRYARRDAKDLPISRFLHVVIDAPVEGVQPPVRLRVRRPLRQMGWPLGLQV